MAEPGGHFARLLDQDLRRPALARGVQLVVPSQYGQGARQLPLVIENRAGQSPDARQQAALRNAEAVAPDLGADALDPLRGNRAVAPIFAVQHWLERRI